jgi:hypothetical protein
MQLAEILGVGGVALCAGALLLAVPPAARLGTGGRATLFVLTLALLALPSGGLPLVAYVRGITGDLSVSSLLLAAASVAGRVRGQALMDESQRLLLLAGVVVLACLLYPFALGVGPFDPYRLGFGDVRLVVALIALALLAWRQHCHAAAVCISLALLAWSAGAYESTNLWDYLIDPWLAVYAVVSLLVAALRRLGARISA